MTQADLFVECFPLESKLPALTAYAIHAEDGHAPSTAKLAYWLGRALPGEWVAVGDALLTTQAPSAAQIERALEELRQQFPERFQSIDALAERPQWQPDAWSAAQFLLQTRIRALEPQIREALYSLGTRIPNGYIMREHRLRPWVVFDVPSLSVSIRAHLLLNRNLQQLIEQSDEKAALHLRVMDRSSSTMVATVTGIVGPLGEHKERLMELTQRDVMKRLLYAAPASETVVRVESGEYRYDYPASALRVVLPSQYDALWDRFQIDPQQAQEALLLAPDVRAKLVRTASDVLKNAGLIGNAYNSRTDEALFADLDFMPGVEFGNGRVRPYQKETLGLDFVENGLFGKHHRFKDKPIRLAVINTLDNVASDFLEALRRQLEKDFGYEIDLIKERKIRVVNEKNIASAVRVVEREEPHLVLAFFPDEQNAGEASAETLKSLTLGKGIASHVVYESTMHNADSMALVIMGVLAKTGNIPYVLAEPLNYAQLVVGFALVREQLSRGDRVVAVTRIYRRDGMFMYYFMDTVELETDEALPFQVLQAVFPEMIFKGKRVIIHHDGALSADTRAKLQRWASVLEAEFLPVEILRYNVPRLYALSGGVVQAPWGSTFAVNETESFVVASTPGADRTARPLHVRVPEANLPVEQAVYSVLAWTLLHYGSHGTLKLPVTIQHADSLAEWLARGMLPDHTQGDVPFWL